jgi:8-oxo-dGTP pyrophosphatase MutT (NUDIX family)
MSDAPIPIRQAATVMLVADRPDLQIFMMERNANTVFAGGMWVFPGGSVDQADSPARFQHISIHRTDTEASRLLDIGAGGLAYYIAAIREAFEEAGVLLAIHRDTLAPVDMKDAATARRFEQHRRDINDSNRNFIEIIEEENLILDAGEMHYVARWITPIGPPRRFDARFFISRMPDRQVPIHDDNELVHSRWLAPKDILARFDSADAVIAAAARNQPDERARVNAQREIVLPGEPGYADADETVENGWVRLRPLTHD